MREPWRRRVVLVCASVLQFASVAAAGLGGCRAEPAEPRSGEAAHAAKPEQAAQSAKPDRDVAEAIDFAADLYLKDACRGLVEVPFKRFESYDFVYRSPLPVRVSGAYYEVRGKKAAGASTVYEEMEATIFRDVEMVVEADQSLPHFTSSRQHMPFAVSNYPFSASRQLQHQRAMGATFPFLDLAEIEQPDPHSPNFSRNFISALNFLATRGENAWSGTISFEERQKARALRRATTGTEYERPQPITDDALAALKRIPPGEKLSVSSLGYYILISLGKPARFVAAIDTSKDAVGLRACEGDL